MVVVQLLLSSTLIASVHLVTWTVTAVSPRLCPHDASLLSEVLQFLGFIVCY